MDRRYLTTIAQKYSGGPVGIETMAAILAEQRDVIEDISGTLFASARFDKPYAARKGDALERGLRLSGDHTAAQFRRPRRPV